MTLLVTGGCGYIGAHVVHYLLEKGYDVVVYDDLSSGKKEFLAEGATLVVGDIGDAAKLAEVFSSYDIEAVFHFAGFIQVSESMEKPAKYLRNNFSEPLALLEVMRSFSVKQIIFSSTAAVYGEPASLPLLEDAALQPTNVYGQAKLYFEEALRWYAQLFDLRYVCLRYFNASGAAYGIGEAHEPETHLIPLILEVALGTREKIFIFGDDYPTKDGTCVRDYVHVLDLASAHHLALKYLERGGKPDCFNLGTGDGYSVQQVVTACRNVTAKTIPAEVRPRRKGDPAILVASSSKAKDVLGWRVQHDLYSIIRSAWLWHSRDT